VAVGIQPRPLRPRLYPVYIASRQEGSFFRSLVLSRVVPGCAGPKSAVVTGSTLVRIGCWFEGALALVSVTGLDTTSSVAATLGHHYRPAYHICLVGLQAVYRTPDDASGRQNPGLEQLVYIGAHAVAEILEG
jgi:hypothetical protein